MDLRPWGGKRMTMRNPREPGWPDRGERTESREVAERWKAAYWDWARGEHRSRVFGSGRPAEKLSVAVRGFLEHRERTVERATLGCDRTGTSHLLAHFGGALRTSQITAPALQGLVDELVARGYQPATIDTYARSWRVFLEWCHFGVGGAALRGGASRARLAEFFDPVGELALPAKPEAEVATLSDAQIPEIFRAAERVDEQQIGQFPSAVLACATGLYMGLRRGEIFGITWQDIRPEWRTVRVQLQVPKDSVELKPLKGKRALAGSVRRRRPKVSDIEIVLEPRMVEVHLFGATAPDVGAIRRELEMLGVWAKGGERYMQITDLLGRAGAKLDAFLVHPPAQWGSILAIRTGPAPLGQHCVTEMRGRGYHHVAGRVVKLSTGETVPTPDEEEFFELAGVPCVAPELRDEQALELTRWRA